MHRKSKSSGALELMGWDGICQTASLYHTRGAEQAGYMSAPDRMESQHSNSLVRRRPSIHYPR